MSNLVRCTHVAIGASILLMGCEGIGTATLPRPEHADKWLIGNRVKYDEGLLGNYYWTIEQKEISDLKFDKITENDSDKALSATITFRLIGRDGRGLAVQGILRYKRADDKLIFVDFTSITVSKFGSW